MNTNTITMQRHDLLATVAQICHLPIEELADPMTLYQRMPEVEAAIRTQVVGQDEAISACMQVMRSCLQHTTTTRPVLQALFVGPSGVGKTELARQLARAYAGTFEALVRLDGAEYAEEHAIARLIGPPPGYVGYEQGGQLTEAVRRRPRAVVLFDEIEKASAPVINAFLNIMDAGRLTDGRGQTVDFRRTLVLFTGNIGNYPVGKNIPDYESYTAEIRRATAARLTPEFIGRLDELIVFRHLTREMLEQVVRVRLAVEARTLRGVTAIEASDATVRALADEAYVPDAGAREVKRVIKRRVDEGAARLQLQRGMDGAPITLGVDYEDDAYVFFARE